MATTSPGPSETQDARVFVVTYLEVSPASVPAATTMLQGLVSSTRRADGCLRAELFQRVAPENQFATVTIWKDQSTFEAGRDSSASKAFRDGIEAHLISGIDSRVHTGMAPAPDALRTDGAVCVVTHVDVPPPSKDACIDLLKAQIEASRKEDGVVRFEVFQQSDRPNHFSVVEIWKGPKDYAAHIVADHTKAFRKKLSPISGALYDERLYRAVAAG